MALVPDDELLDKNLTTLGEIRARAGRVLAVGHRVHDPKLANHCIVVPKNEPELDPLLLNIPLQLFSYDAAVALERDVDRPRNLAGERHRRVADGSWRVPGAACTGGPLPRSSRAGRTAPDARCYRGAAE